MSQVDPTVTNLAILRELPGFAGVRIADYTRVLDGWADTIRQETQRGLPAFRVNPQAYANNEAEFKIACMVRTVHATLGIDYDVLGTDLNDPANVFLNGIVDRKLGTCVSMPLLYVALGWRLGYPIKLVCVPEHCFARWDDGVNRINIEATGYGATLPDEHYASRYFVPPECKQRGAFLASLAPRQTLAVMLLARAACYQHAQDGAAAVRDALRANLLFPEYPLAQVTLTDSWMLRAKNDGYYAVVADAFRRACEQVNARIAAEETGPVEKLVFQPDGTPKRVLLDRKTGAVIPTGDR